MKIPLCEAKYILEARAVFAVNFPGGNFDDVSWGVKHLFKSQHDVSRTRVYFTTWGSEVEPLPARFANIVKASILLMGSSVGTLIPRISAARILWIAIELDSAKFDPSFMRPFVLNPKGYLGGCSGR